MKNRHTILSLFTVFFKIGLFTFGGGYAMIPLIQREVAEERHWISDQDILDIIAIAESTPGPIAINSATFVGYKTAGFWGAFASTLGVVAPSFVIISAIARVLNQFEQLQVIKYAFNGIRAGVLALIIKALFNMWRQCPKNPLSYFVIGAAFLTVAFLNVNVLIVIICCALTGLAGSILAERRASL